MKKLFYAATGYLLAALASGIFARTYIDQIMHFDGDTQIKLLHTHLFAMGMLFMLVLLALEKLFALSKSKWFTLGFWHYNAGFLLTMVCMLVVGIGQVNGVKEPSAMISGIAGLGHIVVTVGLGMLFYSLYLRLRHEKH